MVVCRRKKNDQQELLDSKGFRMKFANFLFKAVLLKKENEYQKMLWKS